MRRLVIRLVFRPPETPGRGYFAWTKERLETPDGATGGGGLSRCNGEEGDAVGSPAVVRVHRVRISHRLLMRRYCPMASGAKTPMMARLQRTE